jgi:hypothetical protein
MSGFVLFAVPGWVNFFILIPIVPYLFFKKNRIRIGNKRLLVAAVFGIAFGLVKASVVVYLRADTGLWPDQHAQTLVAVRES